MIAGDITALAFMTDLHKVCHFWDTTQNRVGSNSFLRRLLQDKAVVINGETPGPFDLLTFPITELVLFPKGKRRTTLR